MTQLKPLEFPNSSGHAMAFFRSDAGNEYLSVLSGGIGSGAYREYDPADDGPEVKVISYIRAKHPLYAPGKEGEMLRFQHFVDDAARAIFGDRYGRLGKNRQATVRKFVVMLHLEGKGPGTVELS